MPKNDQLCVLRQKRATKLLKICKFLNDDVSSKICEISNTEELLALKLVYHNNCFRTYEHKSEQLQKEDLNNDSINRSVE